MRIYSPSQTADWLRCPVLRWLKYHDKIEPTEIGKPALARWYGRALAEGIAYLNLDVDPAVALDAALKVAPATFSFLAKAAFDQGQALLPTVEATYKAIPSTLDKMLTYLQANDPFKDEQKILSEHTFHNHGNARLDLAVRMRDGSPVVVDYKGKLQLEERYVWKECRKYAYSNQMIHYLWALSEELHEPVKRYVIVFVIAAPTKKILTVPYVVSDEIMKARIESNKRIWEQMEKEDNNTAVPWMADVHSDQYGDCPYYKLCLEHKFDVGLSAGSYIQGRKKDVAEGSRETGEGSREGA